MVAGLRSLRKREEAGRSSEPVKPPTTYSISQREMSIWYEYYPFVSSPNSTGVRTHVHPTSDLNPDTQSRCLFNTVDTIHIRILRVYSYLIRAHHILLLVL